MPLSYTLVVDSSFSGAPVAKKPNYNFEKNRKEQKRAKKKEEKRLRKAEKSDQQAPQPGEETQPPAE